MMESERNPVGGGADAAGARRVPRWLLVAAASGIAAVVVVLGFAVLRPVQVVPRLGIAPGFALVDQDGERLTSEDLRGSVTVYTFGHLGCGGHCAGADTLFRALQARLAEAEPGGVPIRLVTVSIDPERDSPAALAAAAAARGADPDVWTFATGDPAMLKNVVGGGFGVYYAAEEGGGWVLDPAVVVVDGLGIVRAEYRVGTPEPEEVLADLRLIAKEARASEGLGRLAYEAAHLFACYPR